MPYTSFVDVLIILERGEHVLLARRAGTGYADGQWNLPSGKLEEGEDMVAAIIREAREEIDVEVDRDDLEMVTSVHCLNPEGKARVGFFFRARRWRGEARNAEPHKCSQIAWFPKASLPASTVPYTHAGVELYRRDERFGLQGWPHPAVSVLARR
ncbi:NUDIX domain-containing protein [Amycolatopsis sp. DG1A-15b]|uniref:NUDIX hydrolase n=1 Tax=Amycolatopsis sp. DG1A-15b TaxID=3052846 RepID=UPI00255BA919|nr:NUDIX domain-containing protein [Amycolatopsis sp. DG1A-15b]WIX85731.1 NUDIX domain-containing protein [Amycolatopsis sp. DG1A-15b]